MNENENETKKVNLPVKAEGMAEAFEIAHELEDLIEKAINAAMALQEALKNVRITLA